MAKKTIKHCMTCVYHTYTTIRTNIGSFRFMAIFGALHVYICALLVWTGWSIEIG